LNLAGKAVLIEHLSSIVPMLPGDLIFTGTAGGVGFARRPQRFLAPGDVVVSTIEGIGSITTPFDASAGA
jgi:2-keto-4-pentenoate hydratase/2-oxohepta-3-ene-1,7-dioic acid hydratase in catechol pathway